MLTTGLLQESFESLRKRAANDKGTPQGGIISPLLANVYLHEVIDKWIIQEIKPLLKGEVFIVRYADDFIIGLEYQSDAERLYEVLPKRLSKYSLELSMEKSRLQNFVPENKERNNTIDFVGFTHYWTKSRAGTTEADVKRVIVLMLLSNYYVYLYFLDLGFCTIYNFVTDKRNDNLRSRIR